MIDNNKVVAALRTVKDPNSGQDIIAARMIKDLKIEGNSIHFSLVLPSLNAPHKSDLNFACQGAILEVYPNANVHVHMMSQTPQSQPQE